jgi:uncharacterized membrane protein
MKNNLGRLGGQVGVLLCLIGFVAIFFGWNGAASESTPAAQFPYLISGGIVGLALVVIGAAMLVVQDAREERARLEATLDRLATAVERQAGAGSSPATGAGVVLAGSTSYHRSDCTLPTAREEAYLVRIEDVLGRGLEPCRVCHPPALHSSPQPSY